MAQTANANRDEDDRKKRNRKNTAEWRKRKQIKDQSIIDDVNNNRKKLNLPAISLSLKHEYKTRGQPRPNYNPSPEIAARMSPQELSDWKALERRKRKAEKQRLNRLKKKEIVKCMQAQLPELQSKVKQLEEEKRKVKQLKKNQKVDHAVDGCLKPAAHPDKADDLESDDLSTATFPCPNDDPSLLALDDDAFKAEQFEAITLPDLHLDGNRFTTNTYATKEDQFQNVGAEYLRTLEGQFCAISVPNPCALGAEYFRPFSINNPYLDDYIFGVNSNSKTSNLRHLSSISIPNPYIDNDRFHVADRVDEVLEEAFFSI